MVVTYSGFTMLARTPAPSDVPATTDQQANQQITPEMQAILDSANASNTLQLKTAPGTTTPTTPPPAQPVPKLDFSL
jgi:hypothetical protein